MSESSSQTKRQMWQRDLIRNLDDWSKKNLAAGPRPFVARDIKEEAAAHTALVEEKRKQLLDSIAAREAQYKAANEERQRELKARREKLAEEKREKLKLRAEEESLRREEIKLQREEKRLADLERRAVLDEEAREQAKIKAAQRAERDARKAVEREDSVRFVDRRPLITP